MTIIKRRAAATDLLEHFVFIGEDSEDAAQRPPLIPRSVEDVEDLDFR